MSALFDMRLRAARRDRAARVGPEPFLLQRAFDDCLDRLAMMQDRFGDALMIGCPEAGWPSRLNAFTDRVVVRDPGSIFAAHAGGLTIVEDVDLLAPAAFDLVMAIGTLDTVNDLPRALRSIRASLRPGGLLIGAMSGGDTLPRLRAAMRAADQELAAASAHVHPRIEPSAVAPLLDVAGFAGPVVDVDRVAVSYRSLGRLVEDLRRMAATNMLSARPRKPLTRAAYEAASRDFAAAGRDGRTTETFEVLHFMGWAR